MITRRIVFITFANINSHNRDVFFIELADREAREEALDDVFYARFDQYPCSDQEGG